MSTNTTLTTSEVYVPSDGDDVDEGDIVGIYDLHIGNVRFGQLYLTTENYTIVWPGNFEQFKYRNDNASHFIIRQMASDLRRSGWRVREYSARVLFVIYDEENKSHRAHRFRFDSFESPEDYRPLLDFSDEVVFARYDFECHFEGDLPPASYAFTSENPQAKSKDNGEMALLLPRTHKLAMGLLREWADKHVHSRDLKHALRNNFVYGEIYHGLMRIAMTTPVL